jgi:amino-acid N-acetyltransferase
VTEFSVRKARTADIPGILAVIEPLVQDRILLGKERVTLYESVQQFRVAEDSDGQLVGCGALHVMWEDLGEVRTLAAARGFRGTGVGHALLAALESDAKELGLSRLFCLTFETKFFGEHGYVEIGEGVVSPDIYTELLRSPDDGVAEFLDLARVKQNTLGNTRMLKQL